MSKIDDGGPAFPAHQATDNGMAYTTVPGMTLRDWFAGQSLAALSATGEIYPHSELARTAYEIADAMLAERNKERS